MLIMSFFAILTKQHNICNSLGTLTVLPKVRPYIYTYWKIKNLTTLVQLDNLYFILRFENGFYLNISTNFNKQYKESAYS